ncbi:S9 family peptidase [Paenibacillus sp. PDC88]|uniref:alpha/beta hydrolase family protein n=1 Tax=Paenibacillus sp. PDC88 TaxID=1884375 RepID=UPI0008966FE5|nr:alpha/beta fold hydrolase [Paenibacillus sp. PDC88]SDW70322.1 X-Pro dipeptidyl-peptidase (S15 family) [Paenibacillus sp. PDC88]
MKPSQADPLWQLLGDLPEGGVSNSRLLAEEEKEGYLLQTIMLELYGMEQVSISMALPLNQKGPYPVVVFNHSHGGNYAGGRNEFLTSSHYLQQPSFAKTLTSMGYAACCMDMRGFNERSGRTESELVKEMLWRGEVLWGRMLRDNQCLLDYICTREDVDSSRIGTIGMSMGALMAWWLAALDDRIKVVVDICGQVDAHTLIMKRGLDHHGFYSYVPGLLKHFTTLSIQERIVPRPRLSLNGRDDRLCPYEGVMLLADGLESAYEKAGYPEHWQHIETGSGHMETAEMRYAWKDFLVKYL